MLGTKSAFALTLGGLAFAFWIGSRQGGHGAFPYNQGLTLRQVNSPERELSSAYIDESPGNPNERGGEAVHPGRFGVQRQQSSGLL
jgi:hypothetical protein